MNQDPRVKSFSNGPADTKTVVLDWATQVVKAGTGAYSSAKKMHELLMTGNTQGNLQNGGIYLCTKVSLLVFFLPLSHFLGI